MLLRNFLKWNQKRRIRAKEEQKKRDADEAFLEELRQRHFKDTRIGRAYLLARYPFDKIDQTIEMAVKKTGDKIREKFL